MCNNQLISQSYPQMQTTRKPMTMSQPRMLAAPVASAQAKQGMLMADVHPDNPQYIQYAQLTPNAVPIAVTPTPSMPISVQPASSGTAMAGTSSTSLVPITQPVSELPESLTNPVFVPGFLRQHIGDLMRVEFLITDSTTDRVGVLREVGASYIVLDALDGSSQLMCDLFSIRFVTIMQQASPSDMAVAETSVASRNFGG